MRKLLWLFIRIVCTAGFLSACVPPAQAQQWRASVSNLMTDSILIAGSDTSRIENAFCLDVTVDSVNHVIIINAAFPVTNTNPNPENHADFTCPSGYAIAHRHLRRYDHMKGPSMADWSVIRQLNVKPVAAVIIWVPEHGHPEYIVYGVSHA